MCSLVFCNFVAFRNSLVQILHELHEYLYTTVYHLMFIQCEFTEYLLRKNMASHQYGITHKFVF